MQFKTKKAAKAAGLKTADDWLRVWLWPKRNAEPTIVKGCDYFESTQVESVTTKTYARKELRLSVSGAESCGVRRTYTPNESWIEAHVFRVSELRPVRQPKPAKPIDLLLAIWTVNRATKRYRDAATSQYHKQRHGLASSSKQIKERLYALKDRGIAEAYGLGRIQYDGTADGWARYTGEGYCFHSLLVPAGIEIEKVCDAEKLFVESKTKTEREARLIDAEGTLDDLPTVDEQRFDRLECAKFSQRPRSNRYRLDEDDDDWDEDDDWEDDHDWDE